MHAAAPVGGAFGSPVAQKAGRPAREGKKMDETEMKKMGESYYDIIRFPVRPCIIIANIL